MFVLKSLRVLGFHPDDKRPIGIKIRKPGKAFKFVKDNINNLDNVLEGKKSVEIFRKNT